MSRHIHIHLHSTRDSQKRVTGLAKYAGILYCAGGKYLLVRRSAGSRTQAGKWAFPGGHIEAGETPMQAAVRECFEEIGTAPSVSLRSLGVLDDFETFVHHVTEPFTPTLNDEHDDHVWAPSDRLPSPMHPSALKVLNRHWIPPFPY